MCQGKAELRRRQWVARRGRIFGSRQILGNRKIIVGRQEWCRRRIGHFALGRNQRREPNVACGFGPGKGHAPQRRRQKLDEHEQPEGMPERRIARRPSHGEGDSASRAAIAILVTPMTRSSDTANLGLAIEFIDQVAQRLPVPSGKFLFLHEVRK